MGRGSNEGKWPPERRFLDRIRHFPAPSIQNKDGESLGNTLIEAWKWEKEEEEEEEEEEGG